MSTINSHNYEAYFLDYHEGNLSKQEIDELMTFVEQNEVLQEELLSFQEIELIASSEVFTKTITLKNPDGISEEEALAIGDLENILSKEESLEFSHLMKNSNFAQTHHLYQNTVLLPDNVVFGYKRSLKQKNLALPIVISMISIVLLTGLLGYNFQSSSINKLYNPLKRNLGVQVSYPTFQETRIENVSTGIEIVTVENQEESLPKQTQSASKPKQKAHPEKLSIKVLPLFDSISKEIAAPALQNKIDVIAPKTDQSSDFQKPKEFISKAINNKLNSSVGTDQNFIEKTIEKVTKKETKISKSSTENRKKFSIRIGKFEYSRNKRK